MALPPREVGLFRRLLLAWGRDNIRPYAWRYRDDPYAVLISEFMLHRTQKLQAETVYRAFMRDYPSLKAYKAASRDDVRRLLHPLGLKWRIEGMMDVLDSLWDQYGRVPEDRGRLIKEKNVGQYIAGATATFAGNKPHALIDTNTVRVVGRVFGLNLKGEARRRKEVREAIEQVCDPVEPRDYYYAMIDLAHKVCRPSKPECSDCPLLQVPCAYGKEIKKPATSGQ